MPGRGGTARDVVRCCRQLWRLGLLAGVEGNLSVRIGPDRYLVTPTGRHKGSLRTSDLVRVDGAGRVLHGFHKPTSELDLHVEVYRRREDVGAVIHAHPPTATAFAVAGEPLPPDVLPEVVVLFGAVPLAPYATPGTPDLATAVASFIEDHEAVLLTNHGAVCWGPDLTVAQVRMESLEQAAKILLAARSIGRVNRLTDEQVHTLAQRRTSRHG